MAHAAGAPSSSADDSDGDSVRSAVFERTRQQQQQQQQQRRHRQNKDAGTRTTMPSSSYSVAASVYVLIEQGRSMSADMRVMWYLKRLGVVQTVDDRETDVESREKCKVVSFVPRRERDAKESDASSFVMDAFTRVYFLTHVNNMVYCLDMSPSNCSVDVQRGHVMLDEMMLALKRSIEGFVMPFIVPGSKDFLFEPQVYITVIVHTPFYTSLAQQVLVQGWLINNNNVEEFIDTVFCEMNRLENALANTKIINRKSQVHIHIRLTMTTFYRTAILCENKRPLSQCFAQCLGDLRQISKIIDSINFGETFSYNNAFYYLAYVPEYIFVLTFDFDDASGNNDTGATSEDQDPNLGYKPDNNITSTNNVDSSKGPHINLSNSDENLSSIGNNNPDSGFINTLRYGMLAVRLLPQTSISNLIVITDGMITLADIQVLDSVLNQLRCIGVACSFLHVSSQFHPNSSHGHVPYSELMQLIATATTGIYLNSFPETIGNLEVNYYHNKFILWSFKQGDGINSPNNTTNLSCTPTRVRSGEWTVRNSNFYGNRQTQLVSKRQISDHVQAHLENIVCCRMREGFIIEDIQFKDAGNRDTVLSSNNSSKLLLKFILPWTNHIYIEYDLILKWPPPIATKTEPLAVTFHEVLDSQFLSIPNTELSQEPVPILPDGYSNVHYTVVVKGPYEFLHDITCNRSKKSQLSSRPTRKCQFQLSSCQSSSCRSSSVPVTAATTTITKHINLMPENTTDTPPSPRIVSSKYRQALIARFWSTMRSIVQTDMLIKHLETYSPSTGHLIDYSVCQPRNRNENHDQKQLLKLDITVTPEMLETAFSGSADVNVILNQIDPTLITEMTEANTIHFFMSGVSDRSPLRSGMPLFYLPTNSNTSFSLKQSQVKLNDQQQNYTDQLHQHFADFWKPVCTLDPDSQWPKWFSTYRIGGGVLILRHDRPLPQWLHMANVENGRYHTLTCRKAAESLFALLKQWCTFVLIDEHSYVKCLDRSETHIGNVSFCIARVSQRPPTCCCLVLHLAFQSCVPAFVHQKIINELQNSIALLDSTTAVKPPLSPIENILLAAIDKKKKIKKIKENEKEKKRKTEGIESAESGKLPTRKKVTMPPQRYVYFLDKPLEKILIRYERIPTQFTTVIFPDGSQSYPPSAMTTANVPNQPNSKQRGGKQNDVVVDESLTGVESKNVTTTTTLSRYLYHKRWIWASGRSRYSKCSGSASLKLELQLAHTLSVLTKIRMREGFKFAHSSSGIINMVLQVDMVEGSSTCPITPTSHCVIQYVLFPPNILHKHQSRDSDYASIVDQLKKKNNEDERWSSSSIDDQQQIEKRYRQEENVFASDLYSCTRRYGEDDYQLITECWIEPQHGFVVVNENQNNEYMSGLTYEQLAEADRMTLI